jgi:hypothetical protein
MDPPDQWRSAADAPARNIVILSHSNNDQAHGFG